MRRSGDESGYSGPVEAAGVGPEIQSDAPVGCEMLYFNQSGEMLGEWGRTGTFTVTSGVRQGRVLSPRLHCSVLQMKKWRRRIGNAGFGFADSLPR